MDREEYMGRNEWLVQFLFTLMVLLVIGLVIDLGVSFAFPESAPPEPLPSLMLITPDPFSPLGMLMGFIWGMAVFFVMGVMKPKKRRPAKVY